MLRFGLCCGAVLFACSTLARGQVAPSLRAPLPPTLPWKGASERLVVPASDPWITPAERTNFAATPDYTATLAWLQRLAAASPLLKLESFGKSAQGRELYFVRASKGGAGKPVLLVQAGIHGGEIDGKDAGLMLLRDIALRGKSSLLDKADLVFVPIFNVDGHERSSAFSRPNQRGPLRQGWRTTAQNLNLNRDYLKADSPEMRAMIGLINRLDPSLYVDLHVTDGPTTSMTSPTPSPAGAGIMPSRKRSAVGWTKGCGRRWMRHCAAADIFRVCTSVLSTTAIPPRGSPMIRTRRAFLQAMATRGDYRPSWSRHIP